VQAATARGKRGRAIIEGALKSQALASTYLDNQMKKEKLQQEKHTTSAMHQLMTDNVTGKTEKLGTLAAKSRLKTDEINYELAKAQEQISINNVNTSNIDYAYKKYEYEWRTN